MAIEVRVPSPLQRLTSGAKTIQAEGATVRQIVDDLEARYSGFKDRIIGEDGDIRGFVNVYVNDEDIRFQQGLETSLKDGDSISILPAMAGGNEDACR
jgi:molybdopterin synthase sulfur carrier subunit